MSAWHQARSAPPQVSAMLPPVSPAHHRMFSDTTITEETKPNFHNDVSTLSYEPPASAFTLDGKFTENGEKIRREKSPSQDLEQVATPDQTTEPIDGPGRSKWKDRYDVSYHWLRLHWPWFVAFLLSGIVCCSIAIGWSLRLKTFNLVDPDSDMSAAIIRLSANIVDIDPNEQVMILDWLIAYDCEQIGCPDANIYFDVNNLRSDSSVTTQSNTKPAPIFTINGANVRARNSNTDRRTSSLTFRTDVAVSNANTARTLQSYPFDKYTVQMVLFAEEANTNNSISISIVRTTGIAVGFNALLQNTTSTPSDDFGTVIKNIEITRGLVVRLYVMFIVIVVWLVTLTFMTTCVLNVFFGKGISSGVLVLPMGTLFAFTQLRSTLPGAPEGFGAIIDFVGLLPCLAILTFCSIFMTAIFLLRDPEHDIPRWQWKQPGEGRRKTLPYHSDTLNSQLKSSQV